MKTNRPALAIFIFIATLSSCVSHKELLYLSDLPAETDMSDSIMNIGLSDLRIQPDDLLSITVTSYNMEAAKPFNPEMASMQTMAQTVQGAAFTADMLTGYFVDSEGFIDFPVVGKVNLNLKTLSEAQAILHTKLKVYLKDVVVNIRYLNLKISVLGEVNRPGTIRLSNKRLTIFEAIGLAGDMTSYSNRSNVVVIREKNGRRMVKRLNLQSSKIFASPFYFLQQNDVLIVEPNKYKVNTVADKSSRIISIVSVGISVLAFTLTYLLKK
jgi:polysaccharide biosynthesis/export protein